MANDTRLAEQTLPSVSKDQLILRLRLALQSAWPYVHQHCTIQTVRKEISDLMSGKESAVEVPKPITAELGTIRHEIFALNNGALISARDAAWASGNGDAALAIESARSQLSKAAHDLRRAETRSAEKGPCRDLSANEEDPNACVAGRDMMGPW